MFIVKKEEKKNRFGSRPRKSGLQMMSKEPGEFSEPWGLTVNEKYLYVCDHYNNRVQVLDKGNGTFFCEWKSGQRRIIQPQSILLHENLFYVGDNKGIQVFTKEGNCKELFGSAGSGQGEFLKPTGICVVKDKLYIVDSENVRIQVWN